MNPERQQTLVTNTMIYIGNNTITTAETATYLGNVGSELPQGALFLTVTYKCRADVFGWVAFGGNIDRSLDHAVPLQMLRRAKVC